MDKLWLLFALSTCATLVIGCDPEDEEMEYDPDSDGPDAAVPCSHFDLNCPDRHICVVPQEEEAEGICRQQCGREAHGEHPQAGEENSTLCPHPQRCARHDLGEGEILLCTDALPSRPGELCGFPGGRDPIGCAGGLICLPKAEYGPGWCRQPCDPNAEESICAGGQNACQDVWFGHEVCPIGDTPDGEPCTGHYQCLSHTCSPVLSGDFTQAVCRTSGCWEDADCPGGWCFWQEVDRYGRHVCVPGERPAIIPGWGEFQGEGQPCDAILPPRPEDRHCSFGLRCTGQGGVCVESCVPRQNTDACPEERCVGLDYDLNGYCSDE